MGSLWDPGFTNGYEKTGSGGFMEESEQPGHLCVSITTLPQAVCVPLRAPPQATSVSQSLCPTGCHCVPVIVL